MLTPNVLTGRKVTFKLYSLQNAKLRGNSLTQLMAIAVLRTADHRYAGCAVVWKRN